MDEIASSKIVKETEELVPAFIPQIDHKYVLQQKVPRKMKKDLLKDKKKNKNRTRGEVSSPNHLNPLMILNFYNSQHQIALIQSHSDASKESVQTTSDEKLSYPLDKMLKRPSYMSITNPIIVAGHFGHSTAFFKRPILEGQFYMQFIFKGGKIKNSKFLNNPSARFGICNFNFNYSFPLGWEDSVAYKSSDGTIISNGQIINKGPAFQNGDMIGVSIKMSPPYKHPDASKISQDSAVSFYKNGVLVYCFKELKQTFYCFAISTFNYSQVQIVNIPQKPEAYTEGKHYFQCLSEKIQYKDLEESNIFKV